MKKAKLVVTLGEETRYLPVLAGVTIGSGASSDVVVKGGGVKELHCTLAWVGGRLMMRAEPSAAVTVNAEPARERELQSDDVLQVGLAALRVQIDGDSPVATVEPTPAKQGRAPRFTVEAVDPEPGPTMRAFRDAVRIADESVLLLVGNLENGVVTNALLRVVHQAMRYRAGRDQGPAEVLRSLNRELCDRKMVGTAVCVKVGFRDGTLTCASAGHPPPLLVRAEGTQLVAGAPSVGLGTLRNADYKTTTVQTAAGEMVVLGSTEVHAALAKLRAAGGSHVGPGLRDLGNGSIVALHL